ncbi:MAG: hypothetical protein KDK48_00615 [Chlamydiia bacterium]|nr:hypothetical protein [Chlamydiia bacterium]
MGASRSYQTLRGLLEATGLLEADGTASLALQNIPLPPLEEEDFARLRSLFEDEIVIDRPEYKVHVNISAFALLSQIRRLKLPMRTSLIGSAGVKALGPSYFLRAVKKALVAIHGSQRGEDLYRAHCTEEMASKLQEEFDCAIPDVDVRNQLLEGKDQTHLPLQEMVHVVAMAGSCPDEVKEHLFKALEKRMGSAEKAQSYLEQQPPRLYKLLLIREVCFSKFRYCKPDEEDQFSIGSIGKYDIINARKIKRGAGVFTSGGIAFELDCYLDTGSFPREYAPYSNYDNPWTCLFDFAGGVLRPVDAGFVGWNDWIKILIGVCKGKKLSDERLLPTYLATAGDEEAVACALKRAIKDHLFEDVEGARALVLLAMQHLPNRDWDAILKSLALKEMPAAGKLSLLWGRWRYEVTGLKGYSLSLPSLKPPQVDDLEELVLKEQPPEMMEDFVRAYRLPVDATLKGAALIKALYRAENLPMRALARRLIQTLPPRQAWLLAWSLLDEEPDLIPAVIRERKIPQDKVAGRLQEHLGTLLGRQTLLRCIWPEGFKYCADDPEVFKALSKEAALFLLGKVDDFSSHFARALFSLWRSLPAEEQFSFWQEVESLRGWTAVAADPKYKEALLELFIRHGETERAVTLSGDPLVVARKYIERGEERSALEPLLKSVQNAAWEALSWFVLLKTRGVADDRRVRLFSDWAEKTEDSASFCAFFDEEPSFSAGASLLKRHAFAALTPEYAPSRVWQAAIKGALPKDPAELTLLLRIAVRGDLGTARSILECPQCEALPQELVGEALRAVESAALVSGDYKYAFKCFLKYSDSLAEADLVEKCAFYLIEGLMNPELTKRLAHTALRTKARDLMEASSKPEFVHEYLTVLGIEDAAVEEWIARSAASTSLQKKLLAKYPRPEAKLALILFSYGIPLQQEQFDAAVKALTETEPTVTSVTTCVKHLRTLELTDEALALWRSWRSFRETHQKNPDIINASLGMIRKVGKIPDEWALVSKNISLGDQTLARAVLLELIQREGQGERLLTLSELLRSLKNSATEVYQVFEMLSNVAGAEEECLKLLKSCTAQGMVFEGEKGRRVMDFAGRSFPAILREKEVLKSVKVQDSRKVIFDALIFPGNRVDVSKGTAAFINLLEKEPKSQGNFCRAGLNLLAVELVQLGDLNRTVKFLEMVQSGKVSLDHFAYFTEAVASHTKMVQGFQKTMTLPKFKDLFFSLSVKAAGELKDLNALKDLPDILIYYYAFDAASGLETDLKGLADAALSNPQKEERALCTFLLKCICSHRIPEEMRAGALLKSLLLEQIPKDTPLRPRELINLALNIRLLGDIEKLRIIPPNNPAFFAKAFDNMAKCIPGLKFSFVKQLVCYFVSNLGGVEWVFIRQAIQELS